MPVFRLGPEPIFPPPELAEPEGLLAIGGDLSTERLLAAYRHGIFPWFEPGGPILWWSPDPRLVLFPDELRITRRLAPDDPRRAGSRPATTPPSPRSSGPAPRLLASTRTGTWITPGDAASLHPPARARPRPLHGKLARRASSWAGSTASAWAAVFCGESMFHHETDASKVALAALVERLQAEGVDLIDCQVKSEHLVQPGRPGRSPREVPAPLEVGLARDRPRIGTG